MSQTTMVKKRDGTVQHWDKKKVEKAIFSAFNDIDPDSIPNISALAIDVEAVMSKLDCKNACEIEQVQDAVEKVLLQKHPEAARAYIIYRTKRSDIRTARLEPDNGAIADYIHAAKYADDDGKEIYSKTVKRGENMQFRKYKEAIKAHPELKEIITSVHDAIRDKKILPSMRSMQFGGKPIERNNTRLYNCFGVETRFITRNGVVSFEELEHGQRIEVLTPSGNWSWATVKNYGVQKLNKIGFRRGRSNTTIRATSSHRWLLLEGGETRDLKVNDRVPVGPNIQQTAVTQEEIEQWCWGYHFGDGTLNHVDGRSYACVRLCGADSKYLNSFTSCGFKHSYPPSYNGDPMVYMKHYEAEQKTLPNNPTPAFIEGYLAADGGKRNGHVIDIQATGKDRVDWLKKHLPSAGHYVISEREPSMVTNYGPRKGYTRRLNILTHSTNPGFTGWTVKSIVPDETEEVWCVEVDDEDKAFVLAEGIVTGNCAFSHANRLRFFGELFYVLLSGCGAGYSVQYHHVEQLPDVKHVDETKVKHHIIEDTIEGWSNSINALMRSHFITGEYIEFAFHKIRKEGAPISSGGVAPGHLSLKRCLGFVRKILRRAQGRKLRPIEVHDIACYIADAVLAGGIRRSALICLFSADDSEMMVCKADENFKPAVNGNVGINSQRQLANNSAVLLRGDTKRAVFNRLMKIAQGWGEPGFYFTEDLDFGCNPCGEISLFPVLEKYSTIKSKKIIPDTTLDFDPMYKGECLTDANAIKTYGNKVGWSFCNLTEINVAVLETTNDLVDMASKAAALGTLQAGYTSFPYLGPVTERIVRKEALLGVSMTGIMDNPEIGLNPVALKMAARAVIKTNEQVAKLIGVNAAARTTTVKPSGTASLELGCVGSGIHYHHARRYFRRVTANPNEAVAKHFIETNPHMVEEKPNGDVCLVFPIKAPDDAKTVKEEPAAEFVEHVFTVYENWVKPGSATRRNKLPLTHNVSCTVALRNEEWDAVIEMVWENKERITAMSFLPIFSDKMYPFTPREEVVTEVDEARWNYLIENYKPVDYSTIENATVRNLNLEASCQGGVCDLQ